MQFPLILEKGTEKAKCEHAVDLNGWLQAGWKVPNESVKPSKKIEGLAELTKEALIKIATAKGIEIEKSWDKEKLIEEISKL